MPRSRYQKRHQNTNKSINNNIESMSNNNNKNNVQPSSSTTAENIILPQLMEWSKWTERMEQILDSKELIRAFVYPALTPSGILQGGALTIFMNCPSISESEKDALKQELQCPSHVHLDFMFIQHARQ
jgi:hypothetical protein